MQSENYLGLLRPPATKTTERMLNSNTEAACRQTESQVYITLKFKAQRAIASLKLLVNIATPRRLRIIVFYVHFLFTLELSTPLE